MPPRSPKPLKEDQPIQPEELPEKEESPQETASSSTIDATHLSGFKLPEPDDGIVDEDAPIQLDEDGAPIETFEPEQITKDAFFTVFSTAFKMPGLIDRRFAELEIQDGEMSNAREASDAVYALLEIYFPSALMPQSETLSHVLVAGPFIAGKVMIVRSILRGAGASEQAVAKGTASETVVVKDW